MTLFIVPRDLNRAATEGSPDEEDAKWDYHFTRCAKTGLEKPRQGRLYLSGDVFLYPGDGQHRLAAEFEAMKVEPQLAEEEIPVVFLPYEDADQVRQLFADLNLNAKPVSKTIGYAFETRHPLALTAKALAKRIQLFNGRVNQSSNSLPKTSVNVITLSTLVQGTRNIVQGLAKAAGVALSNGSFVKRQRELDNFLRRPGTEDDIAEVWEAIIRIFSDEWQPVLVNEPGAAAELRDDYLFPHGLGWLALTKAASELIGDYGLAQGLRRLEAGVGAFNWERTDPLWRGKAVLYNENGTNRVNNTGPAIAQIAEMVIMLRSTVTPRERAHIRVQGLRPPSEATGSRSRPPGVRGPRGQRRGLRRRGGWAVGGLAG